MVINTNNCGYKGEYAPSYGVSHNGLASYSSQSPPTYNHSWHVRETVGEPLPLPAVPPHRIEERCSCSYWPRCEHYQGMRCAGYPPPPPISSTSVVASYGVYHRHHQPQHHQDDDDGFAPRPTAYKGVVVNAAGTSSVVRTTPPPQEPQPQEEERRCGCCKRRPRSTTSTTTTATPATAAPDPAQSDDGCWWSWCRPTIVLLFLVLLVIVFVLVSAILLYYNYKESLLIDGPLRHRKDYSDLTYKPRPYYVEEPCEKTFCAWGAHCVNRPDGTAHCQCPTHCLDNVDLVCGTDNKTYKNHCLMRVASCKARMNTRVKHAGECEQIDPCRNFKCGFGSRCVPSSDGKTASCMCPDKCPTYGDHTASRPVCGSDGVDYNNLCELNRAACMSNTNITQKFSGKCDPCAGTECPEPEICQLDENRNPVCRCGDTCPLEFTPVCGSDGKTYPNECSLRQEACRARKILNIIYRGKCSSGVNPCLSVRCTLGEECAIDRYGIAHCQCQPMCEPIMRPVCSKDGRTFPSECELRRSACIQKAVIEIAYTGVCGEKGPCSIHKCQFGATCVELNGSAHCECPICPAEFEPVCGSDGITYGNECKLRLEACKHRREIRVLYGGPCNGCENKNCDFYSTCESDGTTEGRCVCPENCDGEKLADGAVCGTDGETYATECDLRKASCKKKQYVVVSYKGDCDLCREVNCKYDARCEAGECVCPTNCKEAGDEPVCASNMITYPNECEMQKAACVLSPNSAPLAVIFYGDCLERFPTLDALTTISPSTIQTTFAVSTDRVTIGQDGFKDYSGPSLNSIEREACRDIHCDFEATCELGPDNFPRCTCQFDCGNVALENAKPVCASDLRIYPSICAMKMEACQRQEELRLRPLDLCQGMEVKPCNGEKPLLDPNTGKEFDCGNGPSRQDCPSGSYCHQTTRFAKCCHKDQSLLLHKTCEDSWYGCCPDGKTPAQGPDNAGCPSLCGCNRLGSYSDTCDPETKQCKCRPGVGGEKCDRCEPGFWGLPKISSGHHGCIPCGCSVFGSVRDDCEQMTGRCVCKPEIQGQKCTVCSSHNKVLAPNGCVSPDLTTLPPTSCKELTCYFGATCKEKNGAAICECHTNCSHEKDPQVICGSDGHTYKSACQLEALACRLQKDVVIQAFGPCKDYIFPGTDWPVRRYTPLQFTQPDDSSSPLSKSTRHLLMPDSRYYYERGSNIVRPVYPVGPDSDSGSSSENNLSAAGSDSIYNTRGGNYAAAYRPTPATVRVVTALLGDICSDNADCLIMYSSCVSGACTCLPNYSESPDRQECIADVSPTNEFSACSSSPCSEGSTCIDLPSQTFTCICLPDFTGALCNTEVTYKQYEVPAFDGRSYVRLKALKAYHKLSLELEFKAYAEDGIIMYDQQKGNGMGDFFSLALVKGYVEFRYNLGNGAAVIKSLEKVELKQFHKVVIKRYHRDGLLKLNDGEDVSGESPGSLKALDLEEDTFIGYVPTNHTRVFENIGTDKGLRGCIRKLKIGRRSFEFREDNVIQTEGVHECGESPCVSVPCQNGGTCEAIDSILFRCYCTQYYTGDFCETPVDPCLSNPCELGLQCESLGPGRSICKCPPGRKGENCEFLENASDLSTPEFNGSSFLQYPRLEGTGRTFSIEIVFLPKAQNGVLLYNGQLKNGRGDFISLNLVHGYLQFRFNLGSGIANITSKEKVVLGEWQWARIFRDGREGILQLNSSTAVRGFSGPPLTELNLELPLYVGSLMSWQEVHRLSGASKGFKGAVQRILLNGRPLPISADPPICSFSLANASGCGFKIGVYDGLPCPLSKNPCLNGGLCVPNLNEYSCRCSGNFEGKHCEISKSDKAAIRFSGNTYLQYKNRGYKSTNNSNFIEDDYKDVEFGDDDDSDDFNYYDEEYDDESGRKGERGNRYEIKIKTFESDGLILWRSREKSLKEAYFSVAIVDGYPELSYNLGKQQVFWAIRSQTRVDDGEWHIIQVRRRKRMGFISVDGGSPVKGVANSGAITLRTSSKLWIGGMPSLPTGLPAAYYKGFEGCMHHLTVNAKPLDLLKHTDNSVIQFCYDNEI